MTNYHSTFSNISLNITDMCTNQDCRNQRHLCYNISPLAVKDIGLRLRSDGQITTCRKRLSPWHQNPQDNHRVHKSPPQVPILSRLNPLHSAANLPKIHSDPILPSMPPSSVWSLSFRLSPTKSCTLFSLLPFVPHAPSTSFSFI
jgi:hypothetical protein